MRNENNNYKMVLNEILVQHELLLEQHKKELSRMPRGTINFRKSTLGGVYYIWKIDNRRLSIKNKIDLPRKLARKKYLEKSIELTEKNIVLLKKTVNKYKPVDINTMKSSFSQEMLVLLNQEIADWEMEKVKWMSEEYEMSTYEEDMKTHVTSRGLKVRSKSELIIAEKLDYYGIPYRYEQVISINGYTMVPDFIIFTRKGLIYWEHAGLMKDEKYRKRHSLKMARYEAGGIVPWNNFIVTYDSEDGDIDSRILEAEINAKILPYC